MLVSERLREENDGVGGKDRWRRRSKWLEGRRACGKGRDRKGRAGTF
jgi:hypothetical protein